MSAFWLRDVHQVVTFHLHGNIAEHVPDVLVPESSEI